MMVSAIDGGAPDSRARLTLTFFCKAFCKAALHGGTTTLIDFVQCVHDRTIQESIEATQAQWRDACYCDYGFHNYFYPNHGNYPFELPFP